MTSPRTGRGVTMVRLMVQIFAETTYARAFYETELVATTEKRAMAKGKKLATALAKTLEGRTIATEVMLTENAQRAAFGAVIKSNHR